MKKFRSDGKFSRKQKIALFFATLLTYFPVLSVIYWIMGNEIIWLSILAQSILFALFMSFFLPFNSRFFSKKLDKAISLTLKKGEAIDLETPAGHKKGLIVYGGKLFLTNERVLFVSHGFLQAKKTWEINRHAIKSIKPKKFFFFADNGLEIEDFSNNSYQFNMQNRNEVLSHLRQNLGF